MDADRLLQDWLPGGHWSGREWVCADFSGEPGRSLSVNADTGLWADFSGTERGGDLISLYGRMHGIDMGEAFRRLNGEDLPEPLLLDRDRDDDSVSHKPPPHASFEPSMFPNDGLPSKVWVYRDVDGSPLCVVARYERENGKEIRPWVWGGLTWKQGMPARPRPLYGLDRLAAMQDKPVLIVEGEKTADAAQRYFPTRPCMCWMGGTGGINAADWSVLTGRTVTIWPDNDPPGRRAAADLAAKLYKLDCDVSIIEPRGHEGNDLADEEQAGTPKRDLLAHAKQFSRPIDVPKPLAKVQKSPRPGSQTYEQAPVKGSKFEIWQSYPFMLKGNGAPHANATNVTVAIDVAGDLDIYYDEFSKRVMSNKVEWTGHQTLHLMGYMQRELGISDISQSSVYDGVLLYALRHKRNSVTSWLNELEWDGTDRIHDLMIVGLGAKRSPYAEAVGRCFMIGMVARALRPGCKADCMPVLEGPQGVGKSTALKILGEEHFAEIHEPISSKDFYIAITGKLICEISELHSFKRSDIERIKGVLSTATDRFRAPYDRVAVDYPRSGVFAGTTNLDDWNTDETGARRFWPIRCGNIDLGWISDNRLQLFAEARHRFLKGEDWWEVPEEAANRQRDARRDSDPWEPIILPHLRAYPNVSITTILVDVIRMDIDKVDIGHQKRVARLLRQHGYEKKVSFENGKSVKVWRRDAKRNL